MRNAFPLLSCGWVFSSSQSFYGKMVMDCFSMFVSLDVFLGRKDYPSVEKSDQNNLMLYVFLA